MKDAKLCVDDTLVIDDNEHFHISKVEVFTGDDDYNETDCIEVQSRGGDKPELLIKQLLTRKNKPSPNRLRGEPGVRLHIEGENGKHYIVTLAHHKGTISTSAKEIEHAALV